jgi:hypothetical protein
LKAAKKNLSSNKIMVVNILPKPYFLLTYDYHCVNRFSVDFAGGERTKTNVKDELVRCTLKFLTSRVSYKQFTGAKKEKLFLGIWH